MYGLTFPRGKNLETVKGLEKTASDVFKDNSEIYLMSNDPSIFT